LPVTSKKKTDHRRSPANRATQLSLQVDVFLLKIERALVVVAAACIFAVMFIMVADASLRYLFRHPLEWAHKAIESYLVVFAFFLALPFTFRAGSHVAVDFLISAWPPRARSLVAAITLAISIFLFSLIFWKSGLEAIRAWQEGRVDFGYIAWPTWLSLMFVPIGTGLLIVRLLHVAFTHAIAVWQGGPLLDYAQKLSSDIAGASDE
jgi:TRAP-type C4-dicarboxylate transport system permease small subunit